MLKKIYHNLFLVFTIFLLAVGMVNAAQNNELQPNSKENESMSKDWKAYPSPYSFQETINRIENTLKEKGITLIARIKFSEHARKVGVPLADEELLIIGNPKVGTLLMQEDPTIGLELPLKILVWRTQNTTKVGYIVPSKMAKRHAINKTQMIINKMDQQLEDIVTTSLHS